MKVNPKKMAKHQRLICSAAFNGMRDYLMRNGIESSITLNSGSVRVVIIEGDNSFSYALTSRFTNVRHVE